MRASGLRSPLRNCLGTCSGGRSVRGASQAAQHDPAHRRVDYLLGYCGQSFVVLGEVPCLPQPSEVCPEGPRLHHPATRDHRETARQPVVQAVPPRLPIRSIDDLDSPAALPIRPLAERSRIPRVGPNECQAGQRLAHLGTQQMPPAVPIMQVRAVDFGGEQQAGGIDEDVSSSPLCCRSRPRSAAHPALPVSGSCNAAGRVPDAESRADATAGSGNRPSARAGTRAGASATRNRSAVRRRRSGRNLPTPPSAWG